MAAFLVLSAIPRNTVDKWVVVGVAVSVSCQLGWFFALGFCLPAPLLQAGFCTVLCVFGAAGGVKDRKK